MAYRSEIDLLRTIAIISVLIFHYFPNVLPLGYIGVDLFFCISGFLIFKIIETQKRENIFTFSDFYWKRMRRVLPLSTLMLLITTITAIPLLIPSDLVRFAQSLAATLTFTGNVYFWRTGGYFSDYDSLKPLLHMWSLSIEEQFYLIFPVILLPILLIRRKFVVFVSLIIVITACSLLLNIMMDEMGGQNPAFFLLPSRIWEFGFGVLAAQSYDKNILMKASTVHLAGLIIIFSGLVFSIPVLPDGFSVVLGGSIIMSQTISNSNILAYIYKINLIKSISNISFALYLWHWPIISLITYVYVENVPFIVRLVALLLTFLISIISYALVEKPFRYSLSRKIVASFVIVAISAMMVISSTIWISKGFRSKHSTLVSLVSGASQTNYRCPIGDYIAYGASRACIINPQGAGHYTVALIGNSHAQMYVPSIMNALRVRRERGLLIPLNGCLPTTAINISTECIEMAQNNVDAILSDHKIKNVIIGSTWYDNTYVNSKGQIIGGSRQVALIAAHIDLVRTLERSGRRVFLIGPIAIPKSDLSSIVARKLHFNYINETRALEMLKIPRQQFDIDHSHEIDELTKALGRDFIDASAILCDSKVCRFGDRDGMYFADSSHLSLQGAEMMRPLFDAVLLGSRPN